MAERDRKVKCYVCDQRVPKSATRLQRRQVSAGVRHNAKEPYYYATVRCCLECP